MGSESSREYDFTGYEQLLSIATSKYNELTSIRSDRRKMAEGRLKILLSSAAIFTGIISSFLGNGVFAKTAWAVHLTGTIATFTLISLLGTIYYLWKFLTYREMESLNFSVEDGWGAEDVGVSKPENVENMLKSLNHHFSSAVSNNSAENDKYAEYFRRSTVGLITYFLFLSLLTSTIALVKF